MLTATASITTLESWQVLHTRPRQEKVLARTLTAAGIKHFLPLRSRVTWKGRTRRTVEEPLFPCYLFLYGPREAGFFATATKRVANVIPVSDQVRLAHDLDQIHCAIDQGADLRPAEWLAVGRRVRVTAGPFRDLEGLIDQCRRPDRLVLQVNAMGRATELEIDSDLLEPVD